MNRIKTYVGVLLVLFLLVGSGMPVAGAPGRAVRQAPAANVYYVSNAGNDEHNGLTPETAWRTIAHVNQQTFQPGDTILFRRDDTWRETLYAASSGTPAAWITYGAYGTGAKPRLLGSERAVGWTQVAPNIWQSATPLNNPYLGYYSSGEVYFETPDGAHKWGVNKAYDASFSQMASEYDWSWNANTLYVYAPANPDTRYAAVEVPQRDSCIRFPNIDGVVVREEDYIEYVAFDNLELMYALRHGIYPGYNEIEAHGLRVTNCRIGFIGVKGGASAYCIAAWHSDMLIQDNTIHDCGRRGISLNTYTTNTPGLTIRNVTIDRNHFYNGFHTTGPDISTLSGRGHTFTNFTISRNLIDDTGRWGEGINDGCASSSCTSNSVYISANGNSYTDFYIHHNIIIGSTSRALLVVGMDSVHVYHNTVYASHPGARPYALMIFRDVTGIDMRNNIIFGTLPYSGGANDARCVMDEGASSFSARDHNLYHQLDPNQPFSGSQYGVGGWNTFIPEWDAWRAASGFEAHSPHPQDPLFVDRVNGDFHLRADSPAVDAGARIPGINDAYYGAAPDIGALELTPSLILHGSAANRAIHLTWSVNVTLPATTTWRIEYYTTPTNILTATDPLSATRAYTLTELTNRAWYTVTLSALMDTTAFLSDTVRLMPTDVFIYLPLVLKGN